MKKRSLRMGAMLMALVMLIGILPMTVFAASNVLQTAEGTNSYVLFNSGKTGAGSSYNDKTNPDANSLTNNGYDIYARLNSSGISDTTIIGSSFEITGAVTEQATLSVNAYDVDEEDGETDIVYLVDETAKTEVKVGVLSGMNNSWNNTVIKVSPDAFQQGHTYHFKVTVTDKANNSYTWYVYVRNVSLQLTIEDSNAGGTEPTPQIPQITAGNLTASISSTGVVSTSLYLQTTMYVAYNVEYKATISGEQKGGATGTISTDSAGKTVDGSFQLQSDAPRGTYIINAIVKDTAGNVINTYSATASYGYSAVNYNANGGSQNLPTDETAYSAGDTVTVLFDYTPSKTGHVFVGWATTASATEAQYTANGQKTFVIGSADITLYAVYKSNCLANGHNYQYTDRLAPTCTKDGYVRYTCAGCGKVKDEVLPALGHEYGDDNVCDRCGHTIDPGHTHSYTETVVAATCTTAGYTLYSCDCGHSYRDNVEEPDGHDWDDGVVTKEATCTENGIMTYTCQACNATVTEPIAAGHDWTETVTVEATCTTDGSLYRKCNRCGVDETIVIPAGHLWGAPVEVTPATCTTGGTEKVTCQRCGATEIRDTKPLGHHFVNGVCTRCGLGFIDVVKPDTQHPEYGMYFQIDDIRSGYGPRIVDEYGVLLDYNKDADIQKVAVYLTQEGNLWRRCIACVGEGITYATYVPYLSYEGEIIYTGLNSDSINTFGLWENSDGIWCYSNYTTIGVNLEDYKGNLLLSLYDIGQVGAKTRIFDDLEEMIAWLKEDSTGGHTHSWQDATCTNPKTCTDCGAVEGEALGHNFVDFVCTRCGLKVQSCGEGVYWYLDDNGCLWIFGQGTMDSYPDELEVPWFALVDQITALKVCSGVQNVGDYAMYGCPNLTSVDLADSVTEVGEYAFATCRALTEIDLGPVSVLGSRAFYRCSALAKLTFTGSAPEIGKYAFYKVVADAYYPGTDASWTADVRQNYGGTITWIPTGVHTEGAAVKENQIAPTCTQNGSYDLVVYCTTCGQELSRQTVEIIATGHEISLSGLEPGCTEPGYQSRICTRCGYEERTDIPATGHKPGAAATCTTAQYCTVCSAVITEALGHNMVDNVCTRCGYTQQTCGNGVYWTLDANGCLRIYGKGAMYQYGYGKLPWFSMKDQVKTVIVEDGVTTISSNAFYEHTNLTKVSLGNTLSIIYDDAFRDCSALCEVSIPASVIGIGNYVFNGCSILQGIWVEEGNTYYHSDASGVLFNSQNGDLIQAPAMLTGDYVIPEGTPKMRRYAFEGCTKLTYVTIPDSVTDLGYGVFENCTALTGVTLGNGLTAITEWAFYNCTSLESIHIPDKITNINNYAFYGCTGMTEVIIGNGVTAIGNIAFKNCNSLQQVTIPDSVISIGCSAFERCTSMTELTIGRNVQTIDYSAFAYCSKLTAATLPDSLTAIDSKLFFHCYDLTQVTIGSNVTNIGENAFYWCGSLESIVIPDSVAEIETGAFGYCTSMTYAVIGAGIKTIADNVFFNCSMLATVCYEGTQEQWNQISIGAKNENLTGATIYYGHNYVSGVCTACGKMQPQSCGNGVYWTLDANGCLRIFGNGAMKDYATSAAMPWYSVRNQVKSILIDNGVTRIGEFAFAYCSNATSVTICDSVTSIGKDAFYSCDSLTEISVPASVTKIGYTAFSSCDRLAGIWVDENNPNYSSDPYGVLFNKNKTLLIAAPGSIAGYYIIPETVTEIEDFAFEDCVNLTNVMIPDSVTVIGISSFRECDGLTSVTIPNSVTKMERTAFYGCSGLTSIAIPDSMTTISEWTFAYCGSLTHVTIPDSVTTIEEKAFYSCSKLTELTISARVTTIGKEAFRECRALTGIWVDKNNPNYSSDDRGVFFNKDKSTLIQAPSAMTGDYIVPDTVTYIEGTAFAYCLNLNRVTIGDHVTGIGDYAFSGCSSMTKAVIGNGVRVINTGMFNYCENLTNVTLGSKITNIGKFAFNACRELTSICYEGTQAQWNQITVHSSDYYFENATIYYGHNYVNCVCTGCGKETGVLVTDSNGAQLRYENLDAAIAALEDGQYIILESDATVNAALHTDLYIDLNGNDLTGTLTRNGYKVYGMDQTTVNYTCDQIGYFNCVDENGALIVPERWFKSDITGEIQWYMAIQDTNGYSFHRFYLGITGHRLAPSVTGVGFNAVFCGDEMVVSQLDTKEAYGYTIQLDDSRPVAYYKGVDSFVSGKTITLRINNFDAKNHGETLLYAFVQMKLADGTLIESTAQSITLRQMVESVNDNYTEYTVQQLQGLADMIEENPVMQTWNVDNFNKDANGILWLKPCNYISVSRPYGSSVHPITGTQAVHYGVDLAAASGTPIYASRSGTVSVASYESSSGYFVSIDHGDRFSTRYQHMTHYIVSAGQQVTAGQIIGYVGNTGAATGPHLHFGVYYNSRAVNPSEYMEF